MKPEKTDVRSRMAGLRPEGERADLRPEGVGLRPKRAGLRPEKAVFRPKGPN